jgi:hypothetical protein
LHFGRPALLRALQIFLERTYARFRQNPPYQMQIFLQRLSVQNPKRVF